MYKLHIAKHSWVFESLPNYVLAALGATKPESSTTDVVQPVEQEQKVKGRPHPESLHSLLIKGKYEVFAARLFWFHGRSSWNIAVPRASGSISLKL